MRFVHALVAGLAALPCSDTAEQLKTLKAAYKAKDSAAAIQVFDGLIQSFESMPPKEQEDAVKVVEQAFGSRSDEGDDVTRLFIAASATLANLGPSGEKALVRVIALKPVRKKPAVLATAVEGLGRQANPAMIDVLLPFLRIEQALGPNSPVVVGAANALARYRAADPKVRKKVVGELVAVYSELDSKYQADRAKPEPSDEISAAFQSFETPLREALRALSGAQHQKLEDWKKWWSTAKDADWSAPGASADPDKKKAGGT